MYRGHPIEPAGPDEPWRFVDTKEPIHPSERPCGKCGEPRTPEGHDPCIANLPGVMNACCGHGHDRPYVQLWGGEVLDTEASERFIREHRARESGEE